MDPAISGADLGLSGFLFEWIVLVPDALQSNGLLPFHVPDIAGLFAGWGLGLAAII
jgi:hypothetical protein